MIETGAFVADLFLDGWDAEAAYPRHLPREVLNARVRDMYTRVFAPGGANISPVGDSIHHSLSSPADMLAANLEKLRTANVGDPHVAQARAEVNRAMRTTVNPFGRTTKHFQDQVERKIAKLESNAKRLGALSVGDERDLADLHESKKMLQELDRFHAQTRAAFREVDAKHNVFSSGQRFRRSGLDGAHSVYRFASRHRAVVMTILVSLLVYSSVAMLLQWQKTSKKTS